MGCEVILTDTQVLESGRAKGKRLGLKTRFVGCSFGCLINKINIHNNLIYALFVFQKQFQLLKRRFPMLSE